MYDIDNLIAEMKTHRNRFFGYGEKSLDRLFDFLHGYERCYRDINNISIVNSSYELLPGFCEFLKKYYKIHYGRAIRWDEIIRENSESDAAAYDKFFELYVIYRELPPLKFDTLYITINWRRALGDIHTFSRFIECLEFDFPWFFDKNMETPDSNSEMSFFGDYVKNILRCPEVDNWQDAIFKSAKTDKSALKLFFRLFDKYCAKRLKNK